MKKIAFLIALSAIIASHTLGANTKIFNHTPYQIKVKLSGLFPSEEPYIIPAGAIQKVLTGIYACVIITRVKVWVLDGNKDDFAIQSHINQKVYLDRCFKEIHVIATPDENGEYTYVISISHD